MFQPNPSTVLKRCNISALPCFTYRLTEYRRRLRYRSYVLIIGRHLWPYIKHQSIIGTMKTHAIPTVPKTVQGIKVRGQRSSGRAPSLVLQQDHNLYPTVTATHSTAAANTSLRAHPRTRDCAGKAERVWHQMLPYSFHVAVLDLIPFQQTQGGGSYEGYLSIHPYLHWFQEFFSFSLCRGCDRSFESPLPKSCVCSVVYGGMQMWKCKSIDVWPLLTERPSAHICLAIVRLIIN